jgi:hypothetical protein
MGEIWQRLLAAIIAFFLLLPCLHPGPVDPGLAFDLGTLPFSDPPLPVSGPPFRMGYCDDINLVPSIEKYDEIWKLLEQNAAGSM